MVNNAKARVIALGFFDGVHIAHGALLRLATERAAELHALPAAFTFDIHPSSLILHAPVPLLSTPSGRANLMRRYYDIHDVIIAHYDEKMMKTPWRTFIDDLIENQGAVGLVVGHDFHFGYRGEGNPVLLSDYGRHRGIRVDVVPRIESDGITVSSTVIRNLLAQGETESAVRLLGHPHILEGTVGHGKGFGTSFGFPTVNLTVPSEILLPARGVYITRCYLEDGTSYPAATNIGIRPTVDRKGQVSIESYLLGYSGNLYGKSVTLAFYRFLRPERKFDSDEALHSEIEKNVKEAETYFKAEE